MADPYFDNVSLLMAFDDANNSTTFLDSSISAHPFSVAEGTPFVSTTQSKWGGSALRLDGLSFISTPHSTALDLADQHFTIEGWVWVDAMPVTQTIISKGKFSGGDYNWILQVNPNNGGTLRFFGTIANGSIGIYGPSGALVANSWNHFAVERAEWVGEDYFTVAVNGVRGSRERPFGGTSFSSGTRDINIGGYPLSTARLAGYLDDLRITKGHARYGGENYTPPAEQFVDLSITVRASDTGPLGVPSVQAAPVFPEIRLAEPSALGSPSALGDIPPAALAYDYGPLGVPIVDVYTDFSAAIDPAAPITYVMDLTTPGGLVRVPVSSWQATLQTDVQSYVQCVVPAATDWVPDIEAATEFAITRRGTALDGTPVEYEMARAPAQTVSLDGGSFNYTATISGYTAALTAVEDPPTALDRTLVGVRTVSRNSGNVRVRCNIDWLLRPGQRAYLDDEPIVVRYVNYYVPGFDQYMDVGDRAA